MIQVFTQILKNEGVSGYFKVFGVTYIWLVTSKPKCLSAAKNIYLKIMISCDKFLTYISNSKNEKGMLYPVLTAGAINSIFFGVYGVSMAKMKEGNT